jgi:hypothetical protein
MDNPEALIHDEDLRARLARYDRGDRAGMPGMRSLVVMELVDEQQKRAARANAIAVLPRERRRRAAIREVFENEPPSPQDVRHIHSVLAVCGMPYERIGVDVRRYERRQGNMSLVVNAGEIMTPTGEWAPQPLPFGPKARLILMQLCSEAVRQKSPTIELAETFTAFVRELGFADNGGRGGALTAFKEQLNALAACDIRVGTWNGTTAKTKSFKPIDEFEVWLSSNPAQRSLWPSTVTFSPVMFESLQRHALPVNLRAVRTFKGSARKLDLYFWLNYRLHSLGQPLHISWSALTEQFGVGFERQRKFRELFAREVAHITEVFPKLPVRLNENGMTLQPAGPDVLALPALKAVQKR